MGQRTSLPLMFLDCLSNRAAQEMFPGVQGLKPQLCSGSECDGCANRAFERQKRQFLASFVSVTV